MAGRFKRHISKASTSTSDAGGGSNNASGTMARKKRKLENVSSEDEERPFWTPKHLGDLKAYNRSASEAPAELFRKDLISAMKLADNEPLTPGDYWGISDQWKQEWERGVQVPVNPDSLPEPSVRTHKDYPKSNCEFRLPKRKTRVTHNDFFNNERHVLSNLPAKADKMCRYDMDNLDDAWLKAYNGERSRMGAEPVPHHIFELIVEHLEETCWENIHKMLKSEETLSIEFDEDVICDVCRSPDREEGNEMVFCDICNICVHQACYGITAIPSGSWLCRTCSLGIKPNCDLCPNKGGAMKSTKSGHKWAHVACALWIPEVSIGSVERMEPITKIANIPQSRWALVCVLCRERRGACIQCSVKSCKTAYHVSCAFKHVLEMKAIIEDENTEDVKLRSYCEKHSMTNKKEATSDAESDCGTNIKKKKEITSEQKNQARAAKLRQIEAEFYNHVDVLQTSTSLDIDFETTETIFYYWKLKRRAGFNKPLLTPRSQELDLLCEQPEQDIERMKMFVQLRQYLERVRNLCYMVSRREKLSKSFLKLREQTFTKQVKLLNEPNLSTSEREAITQANHGHFIYDQLYSQSSAPVHSDKEFEQIVRVIAGTKKELLIKSKEEGTKKDFNGLRNFFKSNPYKKNYFNGAEQRRSRSRSMSRCESASTSSTEDSDSSLASLKCKPPEPGTRISVFTSSEDESKPINKINCKIQPVELSKIKSLDSSEEDVPPKSLAMPLKGVGRGRGKRGRGRPRGSTKAASLRENSIFSSEEDKFNTSRESKIFDELMKSTPRPLQSDSSSVTPVKKETDDVSEDEFKKKTRSTRGQNKKLTPIKSELLSSSEEDLPIEPIKVSPSKRGKGRGRGRGRPSSSNPLSSWSLPTKLSDDEDENLKTPTYKLTSEDEERSDKSISNGINTRRRDLFGSSDNKSDISDNETSKPIKPKRLGLSEPVTLSDSDSNDDEGPGSGNECHSLMKTKAAMKEFTPKLTAKAEKFNRKRSSRHLTNDKIKESKSKTEIIDSNKLSDPDLSLFVPQRAAAKKASELITSQNVGIPTLTPGVVTEVVPEKKSSAAKGLKETPSSLHESDHSVVDDSSRRSTPQKSRRGRSSRERIDKDDSDSEPVKKNIFEPPEILPYVPIREAARKAAENLKGAGKGGAVNAGVPLEEPEPLVTATPVKQKKIPSKAPEARTPLNTRYSRTTKSPRGTIKAKDSDIDDDITILTPIGTKFKGDDGQSQKGRSIFSESEDESVAVIKKDKLTPEKIDKQLPQKQQLFRGDFFLRDHQSSSENDDDGPKEDSHDRHRRDPTLKGSKRKERRALAAEERNNFRSSRNITRLFGSDDQEELETENKEPTTETRRKAPDKKLKTSDGRPEHGFQPPVTPRDESRTSLEQLSSSSSVSEKRICESWTKCRPGTALGHVSNEELRGDADASLPPTRKSKEDSGRERELDQKFQEKGSSEESFESPENRRTLQSQESCSVKGSKTGPEKGFKSTFECISTTSDQKTTQVNNETPEKSNFNFTEKVTEVQRLDDIEESLDVEPESKKTKIQDSEEEPDSHIDARVEQPKDSGYKSAINTPEPNEKVDHNLANNFNNHYSPDIRKVKSPIPHAKITPIKLSTLTRKKNLEDVIEERKKVVEQNDDDKRNNISGTSSPSEVMYNQPLDQITENSIPINGPTSVANSLSSNSSAPSSFVEEWREQLVKSPQHPMDGQSYPSMAHHPGIPHLSDLQYSYIENHYPENVRMYFNQMRMVQFAFLQQQYPMPPKTHDNQLEEESNRQADLATHLAREDHVSRMNAVQKEYQSRVHEASKLSSSFSSAKEIPVTKPNLSKPDNLRRLTTEALSSRHSDHSLPNNDSSQLESLCKKNRIVKENQDENQFYKKTEAPPPVFTSNLQCNSYPPTSVVVTTSSKLSSQPTVSPSSHHKVSPSSHHKNTPTPSVPMPIWNASSVHPISTKSPNTVVTNSTNSSSSKTSVASVVSVNSPISSVVSPINTLSKNLRSPITPEIITIDATALNTSPQKRIPIYMQEPKTPKFPEKRSPRSVASSPRWSKQQEKKERRPQSKSTRGKRRGSSRGKKRGSSRYNSISVPKELQGTVYDFDFDDEFGDGPANTLSDLRQLREKRQSIDTGSPTIPQNVTPPYSAEIIIDQQPPPKKRAKEKKGKSKEKTPKREEVDEVAKILEDYRNQQNSTLKRSVHDPSPPPFEPKKHFTPPSESRQIADDSINAAAAASLLDERQKAEVDPLVAAFTTSSIVQSFPEDRTNQLKLKIKGPYANSYISSNISVPIQESPLNPAPPSTTTTLRRMRKKELIRQYCYQDMNPEPVDNASMSNSNHPPQQMRTGITLPKAVASMTSIPTREDYKRYTQDDSSSVRTATSGRRRRQPRDSKQHDWTILDDKGKRSKESVLDVGRKRQRMSKEIKSPVVLECDSIVPGKLKISIGKKGPEVSQVVAAPVISTGTDLRELNSKGKPPKKRLPEESTIMKVMSDNLKYREEIMANFDRGKGANGEKKSKKRRTDGGGSSSPACENRDDALKVMPKDSNSSKLVYKFSKNNNGNNNTTSPLTHPLKIRLSLANLSKGENKEDNGCSRSSSKERMMPLKIKLQRRPEGYVTSKSEVKSPIEEGPGPPPKPPDPPNLTENKKPHPPNPTENKKPHPRISDDVLQQLEARLAATDGGHPLPPDSFPTSLHPSSTLQSVPSSSLKDESGCR